MNIQSNKDAKEIWGSDSVFNMSDVFHSCIGYSRTPAWSIIYNQIRSIFGGFSGLRTIELGCGVGKMSILFALLGAKTTLLDYSTRQLRRAKYAADYFGLKPVILEEDQLNLPDSLSGKFDIAMSLGTAEHFFGADRRTVFDAHSKVLKKAGLAIIWVPNRYGLFYRSGVALRKLFRRQTCQVDEKPFSRSELRHHAKMAGLSDLKIFGGELMRNDFCRFILNVERLLNLHNKSKPLKDSETAKKELLGYMMSNNARIMPWNNLYSYPLVLIGRRYV